MGKLLLSFSMSLDSFVAGSGVSDQHPMGIGGEKLHSWIFGYSDATDRAMSQDVSQSLGAVLLGRRTYDVGVGLWQDTPYPVPSFVVTNRPQPLQQMKSATFTFIDGIGPALLQAQAEANGKDIVIMGADLARQYLNADMIDEIILQLVPVFLGGGERLFEAPGLSGLKLEQLQAIPSSTVTHLRYRVVR